MRGRSALMLRAGRVVVRRATRVSPSSSMAKVVSKTWMVTVWCLCARPSAALLTAHHHARCWRPGPGR